MLLKAILFLILNGNLVRFTHGAGFNWDATFYESDRHSGRYLRVHGKNSSTCLNLANRQLCNDPSAACGSVKNLTRSIDTMGTCVRIYNHTDCSETPMMELRPGTICHDHWLHCEIYRKIESIGGCPPVDEHFRENTTGIIPSGNVYMANVSSTNFPLQYSSNENTNWIITAYYGTKIEINFEKFDIEYDESCKHDKLTVSELISHEILFEGCGDVLPKEIVSKTNQVRINFVSDSSVNGEGFMLQWRGCERCKSTDKVSTIRYPEMNKSEPDTPTQIEILDMDTFQVYNSEVASQSIPNIEFITYKKSEPGSPLNGKTVEFRSGKHMFYIHGYATSGLNDGTEIKDGIFSGTDDVDTVTLLDWRKWSLPFPDTYPWFPPNYKIVAMNNFCVVYGELKDFLMDKMNSTDNVYLVGFSLGAHIAGRAARNVTEETGRVINRITAIDPAGPIFEHSLHGIYPVDTSNTLRRTDATYVDVIHASSELGMNNEAGDLDVYIHEVECSLPPCTHQKAVQTYIASLTTCSLITCPKDLVSVGEGGFTVQFLCDTKDVTKLSSLGYLADGYDGRGRHELYLFYSVNNMYVPGQLVSTGNCSTYQNVFLPAKRRICHTQPSDAGSSDDCLMKPYLSQCKLTCPSGDQRVVCTYKGHSLSSSPSSTSPQILQDDEAVGWPPTSKTCQVRESCRNEKGQAVNFYIAYKSIYSYAYFLIEPNEHGQVQSIRVAGYGLDKTASVLGQTLDPIYKKSDTPLNFMMWNDQPKLNRSEVSDDNDNDDDDEPLTDSRYGHSKGVLAFNDNSGFLLLHTVPQFPTSPSHYSYPPSGERYAQIAICISLYNEDKQQHITLLQKLIAQMKSFNPQVIGSRVVGRMDSTLAAEIEELAKLSTSGDFKTTKRPDRDLLPLSISPAITIHTTSTTDTAQDMFEHLADTYGTHLIAQTWYNIGSPERNYPSSCDRGVDQYTVENSNRIIIQTVSDNTVRVVDVRRKDDHSKWAISKDSASPVTCIGDLNRAESIMKRGGMFICTEDKDIHEIFAAFPMSTEIENCPPPTQVYANGCGNDGCNSTNSE